MKRFYKGCLGLLLLSFLMGLGVTVEAKITDHDYNKSTSFRLARSFWEHEVEIFNFPYASAKQWMLHLHENFSSRSDYMFVRQDQLRPFLGPTLKEVIYLTKTSRLPRTRGIENFDAKTYLLSDLTYRKKRVEQHNGMFDINLLALSPTDSLATVKTHYKAGNKFLRFTDEEEIVRVITGVDVFKDYLYVIRYVSQEPFLDKPEIKQPLLDWINASSTLKTVPKS